MNYQNDIIKDSNTKRNDDNMSDINSLNNKSFFDFISKKTEKLIMALYMVTDSIDMDEALKNKLRLLGVELMSNVHKLSGQYKTQKNFSIGSIESKVSEILSFIGISQTIGFISEMNSNILRKEFELLNHEVNRFEEDNQSKTSTKDLITKMGTERFLLDPNSLFVSLPTYHKAPQLSSDIMDRYTARDSKGHIKDSFNNTVLYKKDSPLDFKKDKVLQVSREERRKQILDFIKGQKDISGHNKSLTIKDIFLVIKDCSEKTIQRELNELVIKGQIIKEGEKRWSRYKYKEIV